MSETKTMRSGFASAAEVARLAGVSRSAVSRAFTPGASVADDTRARIRAAADRLGYHVNHLARGLLNQRTGIICLVIADIATPYQSRLVDRLSQLIQEAGKIAMTINAGGSAGGTEVALTQALNYRAEATVVLSGRPDRAIAQTCLASGQRLILLNRDDHLEGSVNLGLDNASAARAALALFLQAGCRKLSVVSSDARTPSLLARLHHFREAAHAVGLDLRIWEGGRTAYASGLEGGNALFSTGERPDAVFAVTDLLACGVMDAARTNFGLRVPEDLCVIGFDDIEQAGWASYDLTTFRQPIDKIAERIVSLITAASLEQEGETLFAAPLVWRKSVRGVGKPGPASVVDLAAPRHPAPASN